MPIFDEKHNLNQELVEIIFDKGINNKYKTLADYLTKQDYTYVVKDLEKLVCQVETRLHDQVFYMAHLIYRIMELSGNWSDAGEQQVKTAFCRNLLKIAPENPISQEDALKFLQVLETNMQSLEMREMTLPTAQAKFKNYFFDILGKKFNSYKVEELNKIIKFLGSKKFFQGGFYGSEQEFILGEGKEKFIGGYDVIYLEKEDIRTPNNVMSMAAIIGHRSVYIRLESLKTIFTQKWLHCFRYDEMEKDDIRGSSKRAISEGIKFKALSLFGVKSEQELMAIEDKFVKDMGETILYHELGHGLVQHDILSAEDATIAEATRIYGENIYTALLEFMADFAPSHNKLCGPIYNMCKIAKKDLNRATRMYYIYMSDTWFFDTEDKYMYIYSELMALVLLKYVKADQSIDFGRLEQDLEFEKNYAKKPKKTFFEKLCHLLVLDMQALKGMATGAKYTLAGKEKNYKELKEICLNLFKKNDGFVHERTYEFLSPYWTNIIGYVKKISDSDKKMDNFIAQKEKDILRKILIFSAGKENAEKCNFNYRKYILERMKELKIYWQ